AFRPQGRDRPTCGWIFAVGSVGAEELKKVLQTFGNPGLACGDEVCTLDYRHTEDIFLRKHPFNDVPNVHAISTGFEQLVERAYPLRECTGQLLLPRIP